MNCNHISHSILTTIGCFTYEFQILLAGIVVLCVATAVGVPVWRKLQDTNLQTRISHREILALSLREAANRYSKIDEALCEPLSVADRVTSHPDGEPMPIDPLDAHRLQQMLSGVIDWYLVAQAGTEHPHIETRKSALQHQLQKLVDTLREADCVRHKEQYEQNHDLSDEESTEILLRSAAAKRELYERVCDVTRAYRELVDCQQSWINSLRTRIAAIDRQISGPI